MDMSGTRWVKCNKIHWTKKYNKFITTQRNEYCIPTFGTIITTQCEFKRITKPFSWLKSLMAPNLLILVTFSSRSTYGQGYGHEHACPKGGHSCPTDCEMSLICPMKQKIIKKWTRQSGVFNTCPKMAKECQCRTWIRKLFEVSMLHRVWEGRKCFSKC